MSRHHAGPHGIPLLKARTPVSMLENGLVPGMIVSNEPGFYVDGEYGIRIENLVAVRKRQEFAEDELLIEGAGGRGGGI